MRRVSEAWRAWAEGALGAEGRAAALPFLAEVAGQVAHRHGAGGSPPARERAVGERALALLLHPEAEGAARRLAEEPPMLAAFFQNLDLLYQHPDPRADAVAGLVARALELLEE